MSSGSGYGTTGRAGPKRPAAALLCILLWLGACIAPAGGLALAQELAPVLIGFDGEYGVKNSTSAQAIERGLQVAIDEVNAAGGLLGGRPLQLKTLDNRSVPARGIENLKAFAAMPDLVAVVGGRFSPVLLSELPLVHELKLPLIDVWGSADGITEHAFRPSYSFRVSTRDSDVLPYMLDYALRQGYDSVGLLVPNTGWGRSGLAAAQAYARDHPAPRLAKVAWYNWGDATLLPPYRSIRETDAQALILVANDIEGSLLVRELAVLPAQERLPILSHWGVTGGRFVAASAGALDQVDFKVVQTFALVDRSPRRREALLAALAARYGVAAAEQVESPVGLAHAYDAVHLLARAIDLAGSTQRLAIRDALEQVRDYAGLVRYYERPFTPTDHDALAPEDLFMGRFDADGVVRPLCR